MSCVLEKRNAGLATGRCRPSRLINMDILDYDGLKDAVERLQPKTVFNLAAYGAYSRQVDVERIHQTNYIGVLNLFRAMMDEGCNAFVQAGTSSEYGFNCAAAGRRPDGPEQRLRRFQGGRVLPGRILWRCAEVPLREPQALFGLRPLGEGNRLIPTLVSNCMKGKYPNFVNKDISRDFVYIDDCTRAFVKAALTICKTNPGLSINIASGKKTTLEDVARTAQKVFNIADEPSFGSMTNRNCDLADWYGNPALARELMGWQTRISLDEGLGSARSGRRRRNRGLEQSTYPRGKGSSPPSSHVTRITSPYRCYTKAHQDAGRQRVRLRDPVCERFEPYDDEDVIARLTGQDSHVIGVSHSRNFGSQSAFMSGMEIASGDAVILMDGDGVTRPRWCPTS